MLDLLVAPDGDVARQGAHANPDIWDRHVRRLVGVPTERVTIARLEPSCPEQHAAAGSRRLASCALGIAVRGSMSAGTTWRSWAPATVTPGPRSWPAYRLAKAGSRASGGRHGRLMSPASPPTTARRITRSAGRSRP